MKRTATAEWGCRVALTVFDLSAPEFRYATLDQLRTFALIFRGHLSDQPVRTDDLLAITDLPRSTMLSTLVRLRDTGLIHSTPGRGQVHLLTAEAWDTYHRRCRMLLERVRTLDGLFGDPCPTCGRLGPEDN